MGLLISALTDCRQDKIGFVLWSLGIAGLPKGKQRLQPIRVAVLNLLHCRILGEQGTVPSKTQFHLRFSGP